MLRDGLARARRLVEQLLRLAHSDELENASAREVIELSDVVTQCVADMISRGRFVAGGAPCHREDYHKQQADNN